MTPDTTLSTHKNSNHSSSQHSTLLNHNPKNGINVSENAILHATQNSTHSPVLNVPPGEISESQSNKHQNNSSEMNLAPSQSTSAIKSSPVALSQPLSAPSSSSQMGMIPPMSSPSTKIYVTTKPSPLIVTQNRISVVPDKSQLKRAYLHPSNPHNDAHIRRSSANPCILIYGKQSRARYRQRHDVVGTWSEFFKIGFLGFILQLFWIRLIGVALSFFISFALVCLVALVTRKEYEQLSGYSRLIFNRIMKVGSRMALFFFGVFHLHKEYVSKEEFDRIRERYTSIPREAEQALNYPPFYVISNHISITDPLIHLILFGPLSIVCKASVRHIPFFGQALQLIQCIFVGPDNARNVEIMARRESTYIDRASRAQDEWRKNVPPQLLIFPEGTTTSGRQIIRFHSGAFKTGQAVLPVFIDYPYKRFNMSWNKLSYRYIFYAFGQVFNSCRVFILPPYVPNEAEKADWKLYAHNVQRVLCDVGNLYRPLSAQVFASDELFFRFPKEMQPGDDVLQQGAGENFLSYNWRVFQQRAREFGEAESLQSPTPFDESVEYMRAFGEEQQEGDEKDTEKVEQGGEV
mmetsp:Transcript_9914/g.36967  ORF Transcript_9914/g.36967 Transcript_9914/m.36967 type:complete len:577 (+) Transcript_9914:1557-3287(+)